jgi:hypothetical protein
MEWWYNCTILDIGTRWWCGQLHTYSALYLGKETQEPI